MPTSLMSQYINYVFDEVEPFYESTWDLYRESVAKFMQRSCCGVIIDNNKNLKKRQFNRIYQG